ncbi:MAG: hypothetical protein JWM33_2073 [Caulobacteraceae bacterium]|nr:hypothetical protein [Caulobacteraceae bacterium]
MTPLELLTAWLDRQADPEGLSWLAGQRDLLRAEPTSRALAISFGLAPRKVGKAPLALTADDVMAAQIARPGWRPQDLSLDQAARIVLLLEIAPAGDFPARLKTLLTTADLNEQIAAYRGLPLYPRPTDLTPIAAEGLRSAVRAVFEGVAHDNPFPAEQFTDDAWNQMVLKALFVEAKLAPIMGLDSRWNAGLARMLSDYARERASAGRPISVELWRGVGRFADAAALDQLSFVLATGEVQEQQAAALALSEAGAEGVERLKWARPDLAEAVETGRVSWDSVGNSGADS